MRRLVVLLSMMIGLLAFAQQAYNVRAPYDPAIQKLAEDKRGEVLTFVLDNSEIYPGTKREILVYVPLQYDGSKPACLLVCMDGILYD